MKKYLTLSLLILLFLPNKGAAQTQALKFKQIKEVNGSSFGKINAITQDKYGFLWLSDQSNRCVIRYDGSAVTKYSFDPNNTNSLGGYYPECLFADSTGAIWIGFYGQGLDKYDPQTNTFTHYDHDPNDPLSLSNNTVSAIQVDSEGNIWVGTNGGLNLLDQETGTFTHFSYDENDSTSLSNDIVRTIYEDREGTLWIGTGFAYNSDHTGGLNRFDRETKTFTRFVHDPENPQSLIDNKVRAIFEDSRGNLWIGTRGDGLHSLDRKTGVMQRHPYNPDDPDKLSSPPVKSSFGNVTFIIEDAQNQLWIGSDESGLYRYDPESKRITHYDQNNNDDLSSWCAFATSDGIVWFGPQYINHLYKVDLYSNQIESKDVIARARSFYEDEASILWMGTFRGLVRYDTKKEATHVFTNEPENPNSLAGNDITVITEDLDLLWIGSDEGLTRLDPKSGTFIRYRDDNFGASKMSNYINDIDVTSDSKLWLATGGGLELFDPKTNLFTHFRTVPEDTNSLSNDLVNVVLEETKDTVWLGFNNNGGVDRFNPETSSFHHYLSGLSIFDIFKDRQGTLWVGSQNGLYQYIEETDMFSPYFGANRDLTLNTIIYSIIDDDQNNLWVGTPLGIYKVDHKSGNMILYGDENGVHGDFLANNAVYQLADGKILFGYPGGYLEFYPEKLTSLPGTSANYFMQFWLNDTEVNPTPNGPLAKSIMFSKEIVLDHDQNVFSISSASIDFRATEDKRIYYMLENYENDWRTAYPGDRANYFKVPPGKYTFRIKSINSNNGSWSEQSISVQISPPWWLSWWAYAGYGLIFIAGVFMVDRFQRKRLVEKERARMKDKELEQAREIEKAYNDLKTTQKQLIQSEKMASLGELTAGIAHEIQNPLNFVNNFSDLSADLVDEMNEEMAAGNLEDAREIGKDLKDNLDKITHHGQRASSIVKGMLQHSRTSDGKKEPTDINALADEYLRLAYHGLRAKDKSFNAEFKLTADESLPPINVVPQDMGRVLLNLINNAFQSVYARNQEEQEGYQPTVEVITRTTASNVEIRVKDNGGGIAEDIREKIFQPFFTTKSSGEGTGLGLSLSYDIVHKGHGGELKVESKEGIGTEFIVILPSN